MKISKTLKKSLTNIQHFRVLELIGLSEKPLSSYEIVKKYSRIENKYVYEIIKELAKIELEDVGRRHPERFLKIHQKGSVATESNNIVEATKKNLDIIKRNFRYSLNIKGFLLYLFVAHNTKQVNYKTINSLIKNLSNCQGFEFLAYFDIFERKQRVDLLIEIAVELQFQIMTLTREYLEYYVMNRCNDEITFWLDFENNILHRHWKKQGQDQREEELENYKINVLSELITIEDDRLKRRKQERRNLQRIFFNQTT